MLAKHTLRSHNIMDYRADTTELELVLRKYFMNRESTQAVSINISDLSVSFFTVFLNGMRALAKNRFLTSK